MSRRAGACLLVAVLLSGCAEDNPVAIGGLVPGGTVRTVELLLDASEFLIADTTAVGYVKPTDVFYMIAANSFSGILNANALMRFGLPPSGITYTDSLGTSQTDQNPRLIDGTLVIEVDTARTRLTQTVTLALYQIAEDWDPETASWSFRVDSVPTPRLAWAQPGGTRGVRVGSVDLTPGSASVSIAVDSATMAQWADTTSRSRGAMVVVETPDVRIHISSTRLRFRARPAGAATPIVTDSVFTTGPTYVFDPAASPGTSLLVGGNPSWRSFLRLRERLDTLTVPGLCPPPAAPCRLGDATVNFASLLLQPLAPPTGFAPTDTIVVDVRPVFGDQVAPIVRAPLGGQVALPFRVAANRFLPTASRIEVPITGVIAALSAPVAAGQDVPRAALALLAAVEGAHFGVGAFGSRAAGVAAPKLRVIVSVSQEALNP